MSKKILYSLLFLLGFLIINSKFSMAASPVTYYLANSIKIENENIEFVSDEITIDTTNSKVNNTLLLKNNSNEEAIINVNIPLEIKDLSIYVKNLNIKINNTNVKYIKNDNGEYIVKTKVPANSGKKIEIEYITNNDLNNAKTIKYNFDNLKNKKVDKLKVNIKIDEKTIPLVQKIYPGHYTFNNNIISVEYYNYKVNSLTKEVILTKETFNNLLYGREISLTTKEKDIIEKWSKEKNFDYEKLYNEELDFVETHNNYYKNIIDYLSAKNNITEDAYSFDLISSDLIYEIFSEKIIQKELEKEEENEWTSSDFLHQNKICIDYVETEQDKDLYVLMNTNLYDGGGPGTYIYKEILTPERKILQSLVYGNMDRNGAKVIFINQGINGECLGATDAEKIEYINSINADMYIRVELYSGDGDIEVGYYDDNNSEIVKEFLLTKYDRKLMSKEDFEIYSKNDPTDYPYSSYEDYTKNYLKDYYKEAIIKLDNSEISNKSEIPTVVQFVGSIEKKNNKYVIEELSDYGNVFSSYRGLITCPIVLETSQAKKMLKDNKEKNANIKKEIENNISSLEIQENESQIQEEISDISDEIIIEKTDNNIFFSLNKQNIMILATIATLIIISLLVLIIINVKSKNKGE